MKQYIFSLIALFAATSIHAAEIRVPVNEATGTGTGTSLGHVVISESPYGLVFTPDLQGLEPGIHGFHVHVNPSCDPATVDGKVTPAGAAGGHYDPKKTGKHGFPWVKSAHLGDLPALYVSSDGKATQPVLAPRLKRLKDVQGRSLMVHKGGDNHSDHPQPLGGGGARVACGIIK